MEKLANLCNFIKIRRFYVIPKYGNKNYRI